MNQRLAVVLAVLGFASPALARAPVELSDGDLDHVAAGTGSLVPATNINVNASPITVTQTAVALNLQSGTVGANAHGKGKAKGLLKQSGFAVASNVAKINYHVVQVNGG